MNRTGTLITYSYPCQNFITMYYPYDQSYTNANEPIASRIRKIISFEFGKEIEKDVLSSCHEHATKKNS